MNDWKRLFKHWILDRGYEYYLDDAVLDLSQSNNVYTACVTGSEDYEVFIEVKDGYVRHMSCTCPYACDGENCKHMAAVLYEINDGEDEEDDEDTSNIGEDNINDIIETLNEFELKSVLHEIIHNSSEAYSIFQNKFMKRIVGNTNILSCIKDVFMEYDDYIDYEEAFDFHDELDVQIDNIKVLVNNARYQEAYNCAKYIIEQSQYLEIDDSAGCWYMDLLGCLEIIHDILSKNTIINNNILPWLSNIINMPNLFFEDKILDILEEFQDIGEFLHNKITTMKEDTERYYNIEKYLEKMYTYLKSHDKSVIEFVSENMEYSIVRRRFIEDLIIQKKYQEALSLLKKSRSMDMDKRGLVNQYCQQIVDIYCELKELEEAITEAKQWLYEYSLGNLEAFLVLKSLYKEKWSLHQQEVIHELENRNTDMLDIYQEEKMYDFLLDKMIDDTMPYRMKKYEKVLKPVYPKELLEFFSKHIQIALIDSNSRKYYQGIVRQMNDLLTYPNGEKEVITLVEIIKNKYKNRPALLDELRRVKLKR